MFDSSDRVQHVFWEGESVSDPVINYYEKKDELLGEIVEQLDDDTLLLIISDHGFTSFDRSVSLNTWLVLWPGRRSITRGSCMESPWNGGGGEYVLRG